jgi:hypothetical protein
MMPHHLHWWWAYSWDFQSATAGACEQILPSATVSLAPARDITDAQERPAIQGASFIQRWMWRSTLSSFMIVSK